MIARWKIFSCYDTYLGFLYIGSCEVGGMLMKWIEKLAKWNLTSLKINMKFAEMEFVYTDADEKAAWEMYVEIITRVLSRSLFDESGDEKAALQSIYSLFPTTRELLKTYGREGQTFSKLAVIILNQIIRPFTTKWHNVLINEFLNQNHKIEFRNELETLQNELRKYARALAEVANVEDISEIDFTIM